MNDDTVESDEIYALKGGKNLMEVYDNEPTESDWEIFWKAVPMGLLVLASLFIFFVSSCNSARADVVVDGVNYSYDQIADAIYLAEGGVKAKKPYGILSVKCESHSECRRICINTIRNNVKRFSDYGHKDYPDYLSFLASRYAPLGVENDPSNLNQNWLRNVRSLLAKGVR